MPREITIPRLGWSMEEGVFGEWLKAPGALVRTGDMVFALEGDKATHEIESFDTGYLCVPEDAPQPGDSVLVGQVIGFLLAEGEEAPVSVRQTSAANPPAPSSVAAATAARAAGEGNPQVASACETPGNRSARAVATPRARRLAATLGIDWTQLQGTGRHGRIRERDLLARPVSTDSAEPAPGAPGRLAPASPTRRALARQMAAAVTQAAPVTLTTKVDATALMALRERWKTDRSVNRFPTHNDLLVKLAASALRAFPELNACWRRDGIWYYDAINVAIAVDTERGLTAPVIHQADQLPLAQIAERSRQLIELARAGRLSQSQLQGGTFTVSNLGMFGVDGFTPLLNLPQAGILGIGRIVEEPVVRDGELAAGRTLTLSLTFDHRVIDGAPAARWLQHLTRLILAPEVALSDADQSAGLNLSSTGT